MQEVIFDSKRVYETNSKLQDGSEYRVRYTIEKLCAGFEAAELGKLRWVVGVRKCSRGIDKAKRRLGLEMEFHVQR